MIVGTVVLPLPLARWMFIGAGLAPASIWLLPISASRVGERCKDASRVRTSRSHCARVSIPVINR